MVFRALLTMVALSAICTVTGSCVRLADAQRKPAQREAADLAQRKQDFGEQVFVPDGGFVLSLGQPLPDLMWEDPEWIAKNVGDAAIRTRWFNERLEQVTEARTAGRYYVYGEVSGPGGSLLRRAMTCCHVGAADLRSLAERLHPGIRAASESDARRALTEATLHLWRGAEEGAVALAALMEAGEPVDEPRVGQWRMENATRHVRLKRKLMGLGETPIVDVKARPFEGGPAPVLRRGGLAAAGVTAAQVDQLEESLNVWHRSAGKPTAIVVARNGVIVLDKVYGSLDGRPVTIDTPMLLHSAMKPLIGLQLAMYVDRGHVALDEPIGAYLPDFSREQDQGLTFRAGHVHATGIHFPWPLAFQRLFYFRTWQDSMIAHRTWEWAPGQKHKYGIVGIILAVRALELLSGRNYWHAMEQELFEPLGIANTLPGGTGFSAENLARIGVLLANKGRYGNLEIISQETYRDIVPTSLAPHFPSIRQTYGIGLQDYEGLLGPGSYGHGGGCGTQLIVNPEKRLVFAMVRNERGENYKQILGEVMARLNAWVEE